MAATPSKPSPSNKDAGVYSKAPPEASLKTAPVDQTPPVAQAPPEVVSLKSPPQGSMPTYESTEKSRYYTDAKVLLNDGDFENALATIEQGIESAKAALGDSEENTLHESMAPFHYLYGTTLLYCIEETQDLQQKMTQGETEEGDEEEAVEDSQIAWENLDTARTILEQMLEKDATNDKLRADLAQIFLREGDLMRHDSNYDESIAAYTNCLKYRENNSLIAPYDRKIADAHYNLGLAYFMLVAEAKVPAEDDDDPAEAERMQKKLAFSRSRGFYHCWQCGRVFGGHLAFLCGADPAEFLEQTERELSNFKSTGEEDGDASAAVISNKLQTLRKRIATLKSPAEQETTYNDFTAILEEIQETVDEAENSEKGVHEVTEMKEQISAAVAAQGEEEGGGETATGFGSSAAAASTATAQPLMVVKKKKKRNMDEDGEDAKLPAKEPVKRAKAE